MANIPSGKLILLPTPLGGKDYDFLKESDHEILTKTKYFIVETPKIGRKHILGFLPEIDIRKLNMRVLDEHTDEKQLHEFLTPAVEGSSIILVSDAGVPAVADPGSNLVRLAHKMNIEVLPIAGPSSILYSIAASGLNGQSFAFNGYLPVDRNERANKLAEYEVISREQGQTQIFIETPYRNKHLWRDLLENLNADTQLCIAVDLDTTNQFIKTAAIKDWKNMKWPELDKKQAVFLFLSI